MAEHLNTSFWNDNSADMKSAELSVVEIELRNKFVDEFVYDYNEYKAAIRCGFSPSYAEQYASQFMSETYVQRRIKELRQALPEDAKEQRKQDEQTVLAALRQAISQGPFASRVAAAARMAVILGMDAPTKSEQTINHRGGVMAVPAIANMDEWEAAAADAQSKLVADTQL